MVASTPIILTLLHITGIYSKTITTDSHLVEEIQHAVCRVATQEIQASANASITRQLKGVCSTKYINKRLNELETALYREIQVLKLMLQGAGFTTPKPSGNSKILENYPTYSFDGDYDYGNEIVEVDDKKDKKKAKTKRDDKRLLLRHAEISRENETIVKTDLGKAFAYYWKIPNAREVFEKDLYLLSPPIEYLPIKLFIKFSVKYLGSSYAALEVTEPNSFWNYYRFVILSTDEKYDLNSPLFSIKLGKIFRISRDKLLKFLIDDCLIIKLLIYLN